MKRVTLGDVADWGSGGTPSRGVPEYFGDGVPWLSIADLNDGMVSSAKESLTESGVINSSAKIVPPGTLFVAMYGSIGKLGIAARHMATSQAIAFAKPHVDEIDVRYLFHFLLAERPALQALGRGGTQMNIGQADLKAWPIPLLPIEEQRRIVAILDQADAIRTKRRQALARLDVLAKSLFRAIFDEASTARVTLGSIAAVKGGKRLPKGAEYSPIPTDHPYIRVTDLRDGGIRESDLRYLSEDIYTRINRYTVTAGDVVISIAGSIGITAVVPESLDGANLTENAAKILTLPGVQYDEVWLDGALRSRELQAQIVGKTGQVTIGKLALFRIEQLELALPALALQREFARRVAGVDARRGALERALAADNELFASLQSRAFRGEL